MEKHLILLHGALGAESQFERVKGFVRGYDNVHTFNFQGHGGSPLPSQLNMVELTNQLSHFIKQVVPVHSHLTVFGYSMGGYAALLLASQNICNIGRIITLGTKLRWTPEIAEKEIHMLNPEILEKKVPAFVSALTELHAPQDWKELMRLTREMIIDLGNQQYLSNDVLAKINVPVKFMIGDRDNMVTLDETVAAFRTTPGASLAVLPDTAHPVERVNFERLCFEIM